MDNATHDNLSEQLVKYLDGEMEGGEQKLMEELLASDEAARAEYERLRQARAAVQHYGLQQQVGRIHGEMMKAFSAPGRIKPGRRIFRYSVAVAASLILLIGGYMAYNFYTLSPNKVVAAHYHAYTLPVLREGNGAAPSAIEKLYADKDYRAVTDLAEKSDSLTVKDRFLAAVSHLELKQNDKAIEDFKKVISANQASGEKMMNDEAEYYLALTYISNRDYDLALPLLRGIKEDPDHIYHREVSARLIRQVKMLKWR